MSPNVGNFVHDLVEMAKAMETLPQVQLELDHAKLDQHNLSVEIDRIKADLEQSRNYAASLEQKVRTVEAERDDAEIRFLELDEKAHKAITMVGNISGLSLAMADLLNLSKPQPEPVQPLIPEIVQSIEPDWKQDQAETSLIKPQGQSEGPSSQTGSSQQEHGDGISPTPQPPTNQDQSEVNPTAVSTGATQENAGQSPATSSDVGSSLAGQEGGGDKSSGPYTGKRYVDVPGYVSFSDWVDGGGTYDGFWASRT